MGGYKIALYHILLLALIQGITEFLPVSSSGHLVVTSQLLGWPDQGLVIDVAVHLGTLFAVMLYFWRDIWFIAVDLTRLAIGRGGAGAQLAGRLLIATVPVFIVGYLARDEIGSWLRDAEIIAWATIGFAIVLWIADRLGMTVRRIEHIGVGNAVFIGLMQVLALVPGVSRSGITMTAGRLLGLERQEAARFSLLLSIPTIVGAAALSGVEIYQAGDPGLGQDAALAVGLSFVTGLAAIAAMMHWLKRAGFGIFVVYRLALGAGLLYWIYS